MLVIVNLLVVLALGAVYYLAGVRFAPDISFLSALGVAVAAGMIACLATYLVLVRQRILLFAERRAGTLPLFMLVFFPTIGIMLSVAQLILATASPVADMNMAPLVIVVLNLLVLGLASFTYVRSFRA